MAALFDSAHPFWQGAPRSCSSVAIPKKPSPDILETCAGAIHLLHFHGPPLLLRGVPKLRNTNGQA
jgi:hypothetical protein